jgi:hypothetical protein
VGVRFYRVMCHHLQLSSAMNAEASRPLHTQHMGMAMNLKKSVHSIEEARTVSGLEPVGATARCQRLSVLSKHVFFVRSRLTRQGPNAGWNADIQNFNF